MASTSFNFISGQPILVTTTKDPITEPPVYDESRDWVVLHLVAHTQRQSLYLDRHGAAHAIREPVTDTLIRSRRFHASRIHRPRSIGSILCRALGLDEIDDNSAYRLARGLFDCVSKTGSLDLIAEFEVVCNDIVAARPEIEDVRDDDIVEDQDQEDEELVGTCSICLGDLFGENDSDSDVILTRCSHRFHEHCLVRWMEKKQNSCPLCRAELM